MSKRLLVKLCLLPKHYNEPVGSVWAPWAPLKSQETRSKISRKIPLVGVRTVSSAVQTSQLAPHSYWVMGHRSWLLSAAIASWSFAPALGNGWTASTVLMLLGLPPYLKNLLDSCRNTFLTLERLEKKLGTKIGKPKLGKVSKHWESMGEQKAESRMAPVSIYCTSHFSGAQKKAQPLINLHKSLDV